MVLYHQKRLQQKAAVPDNGHWALVQELTLRSRKVFPRRRGQKKQSEQQLKCFLSRAERKIRTLTKQTGFRREGGRKEENKHVHALWTLWSIERQTWGWGEKHHFYMFSKNLFTLSIVIQVFSLGKWLNKVSADYLNKTRKNTLFPRYNLLALGFLASHKAEQAAALRNELHDTNLRKPPKLILNLWTPEWAMLV